MVHINYDVLDKLSQRSTAILITNPFPKFPLRFSLIENRNA